MRATTKTAAEINAAARKLADEMCRKHHIGDREPTTDARLSVSGTAPQQLTAAQLLEIAADPLRRTPAFWNRKVAEFMGEVPREPAPAEVAAQLAIDTLAGPYGEPQMSPERANALVDEMLVKHHIGTLGFEKDLSPADRKRLDELLERAGKAAKGAKRNRAVGFLEMLQSAVEALESNA